MRSSLILLFTFLTGALAAPPLAADDISDTVPTEGIYPDIIDHPIPDDLSQFQPPDSLMADLKAITSGTLQERLAALKVKAKHDLVFVKGGAFLMGDFGSRQSKSGLPWTADSDDNPLHKVSLDGYSISKYKVTQAELDLYTWANDLPRVAPPGERDIHQWYNPILEALPFVEPTRPKYATWKMMLLKPAKADWDTAQAYCEWMGGQLGVKGSLPTEAQWEYAARDRGKFILFATNNGLLEPNKNVSTTDLSIAINEKYFGKAFATSGLIALFPATPLGLYDMTMLAKEWVYDWYSPDYYKHSKGAANPTGPSSGKKKVLRESGTKILNRYAKPKVDTKGMYWGVGMYTFRCTINGQQIAVDR